jgi:hypothetical protein
MKTKFKNLALVVPMVVIGAGCGSSGSSSTSSTSTNETRTLSGKVIDGYISGATVCIDENNNSKCDSNELEEMTDSNGSYTFSNAPIGVYQIIATGGKDIVTGEDFNQTLLSIAEINDKNITDLMVTPVSTLIASKYLNHPSAGVKKAKDTITTQLDINNSVDILKYDFVDKKDMTIFNKNQEVLNSINILNVVKNESNASFDVVGQIIQADFNLSGAINKIAKDHNLSVATAQLLESLNSGNDATSNESANGNINFEDFMKNSQDSYKDKRDNFEKQVSEFIKPIVPIIDPENLYSLPVSMENLRAKLKANYTNAITSSDKTKDNSALKTELSKIVDISTVEPTKTFGILENGDISGFYATLNAIEIISNLQDQIHMSVIKFDKNSSNGAITIKDNTFDGEATKTENGYELNGTITDANGSKFVGSRKVELKPLDTTATKNISNELPNRVVTSESMIGTITTNKGSIIKFELVGHSTGGTISNLLVENTQTNTKLSVSKIEMSSNMVNKIEYGFINQSSNSGSVTGKDNNSIFPPRPNTTPPEKTSTIKKLKVLNQPLMNVMGQIENKVDINKVSESNLTAIAYSNLMAEGNDSIMTPEIIKVTISDINFTAEMNGTSFSFNGNSTVLNDDIEINGTVKLEDNTSAKVVTKMATHGISKEAIVNSNELGDFNISYVANIGTPFYMQVDSKNSSIYLTIDDSTNKLTAVDNLGATISTIVDFENFGYSSSETSSSNSSSSTSTSN